jgi:uracil-DNA glycosylase
MDVRIEPSWKELLKEEFDKEYFKRLSDFVKDEYARHIVYPKGREIFNSFQHCTFDNLRVVLLGQDPYHGPGQAHGLCFSVSEGVKMPPSLVNIFKEIKNDLGKEIPQNGNLERWADQGILLLNATLTVRAHSPGSHQNKGWENFTDQVIKIISEKKEGIVFLLWGAYAQKKGEVINKNRHLILSAPHPSPFSADRGFFGCRHFSKTNAYLVSKNLKPIDW